MMPNQNCGQYQRTASCQQQGRPGMSFQQPVMRPRENSSMAGSQPQDQKPSQNGHGHGGGTGGNFSGMPRQQLMNHVMMAGFACVDASLYLDTHPDDEKALSYFKEKNRIYQDAVEEYSKTYGPLTIAHAHHCGTYWNWVDQPWPWQ